MMEMLEIFDIFQRISANTGNDLGITLSLALDMPELLYVSDRVLLEKLKEYENTLTYRELSDEDYEDEDSF